MGMLDFEAAVQITGSRFCSDATLIWRRTTPCFDQFMINTHTPITMVNSEVYVPYLVNAHSFKRATGQPFLSLKRTMFQRAG